MCIRDRKDLEVLERARKSKILNKALEIEVSESVFEELRKIIQGE